MYVTAGNKKYVCINKIIIMIYSYLFNVQILLMLEWYIYGKVYLWQKCLFKNVTTTYINKNINNIGTAK